LGASRSVAPPAIHWQSNHPWTTFDPQLSRFHVGQACNPPDDTHLFLFHSISLGVGGTIYNNHITLKPFKELSLDSQRVKIFFFFWWGLLHGPQQGPDRMKEKTYKTGKRKTPA
jgi:hypothetical protein